MRNNRSIGGVGAMPKVAGPKELPGSRMAFIPSFLRQRLASLSESRRRAWGGRGGTRCACCRSMLPGNLVRLLLGDPLQSFLLSTLQVVLGQLLEFRRSGDGLVCQLLFQRTLHFGPAFPRVVLLLPELGNTWRPFTSVSPV